jgi:hypothetical protein
MLTSLPDNMLASRATNVVALSFQENLLTNISEGAFAFFPRLEALYLSSNRLPTIRSGVFLRVPNLQMLAFRGNSMIEFPHLPDSPRLPLVYIDANRNKFGREAGLFGARLPAALGSTLTTLIISDCEIAAVHPQLLSHTTNLRLFDANQNVLESFPDNFFRSCIETLQSAALHVRFGWEPHTSLPAFSLGEPWASSEKPIKTRPRRFIDGASI